MANKGGAQKSHDREMAKDIVLAKIREGRTVEVALRAADRSLSWYESNRRSDREWAEAIDVTRANRVAEPSAVKVLPPFPEFSAQHFGQKLFPHHLQMLDAIEGREPRDLHPSMIYEPGSMGARRVLITLPPNHAKTTLMINYVTYRLLADPNISIILVSRTRDMAAKLLYAVKNRLTHPRYARMQAMYGPPDGFKAASEMWTQGRIYLGQDSRDSGEKDPSVEALGIGSQVYGARASLVILDDTVTLGNASEWAKQDDWLRQEISTRLGPGGQIIIVGTRVAPMDLYRHLRDETTYTDGVVPWTYLAMPAILELGADAASTKTLWPVGDAPFAEGDAPIGTDADGNDLYERWTATRLGRVRNEVGPKRWSLVYMNSDVAEDAIFDALCVRACVDASRPAGPPKDREGWSVMIGIDPAIAGQAGLCVYAVHRTSGKRQVLDIRSLMAPTPKRLKEELFQLCEQHSPTEIIIETNAYQGALAQDEEITEYAAQRGIVVKPHLTGREKLDPEMGVASMSGLFGSRTHGSVGEPSVHNKDNLITLPRIDTAATRLLVEELVAWNPETPVKRRRQDLVMSMYFCERRARELIIRAGRGTQNHLRGNSFLSERDKARQMVINLSDWQEANQQAANWV